MLEVPFPKGKACLPSIIFCRCEQTRRASSMFLKPWIFMRAIQQNNWSSACLNRDCLLSHWIIPTTKKNCEYHDPNLCHPFYIVLHPVKPSTFGSSIKSSKKNRSCCASTSFFKRKRSSNASHRWWGNLEPREVQWIWKDGTSWGLSPEKGPCLKRKWNIFQLPTVKFPGICWLGCETVFVPLILLSALWFHRRFMKGYTTLRINISKNDGPWKM